MSRIFCWFASAVAVERSRSEWQSARRAAVSLGCSFGKVYWLASLPARSARSWRGGLCRLFPKWRPIFFRLRETQPAVSPCRCSDSLLHCHLLTGLLMGIYPALQGSHADLVGGLKEGGRGTSGSIRQQRFRKILVGAQVALSVTLFAGAALLITSFIRLSQQNLGFQPHNLWTGAIGMPAAQYPDGPSRQRFAEKILAALRNTPGIENATVSGDIPPRWWKSHTLRARGSRCTANRKAGHCTKSRHYAGLSQDLGNPANRRT